MLPVNCSISWYTVPHHAHNGVKLICSTHSVVARIIRLWSPWDTLFLLQEFKS
jgi:hypothetical protein